MHAHITGVHRHADVCMCIHVCKPQHGCTQKERMLLTKRYWGKETEEFSGGTNFRKVKNL